MAEFLLGGQIDPATKQRTDATTSVASGDLTTHGVIVGMTGSGKTGLGIVLIEEALRSGVPALLIDPKGDLTNLCLTFPDLAPTDFEPWVNEGDAAKAGQSVAEFAAAQAESWRAGLDGWGLGGASIAELRRSVEFTIYTPGSTGGVGLDIVGSLAAPDTDDHELIGDEIEGYVSGLLGLVGIDADPLSSREHILLSNLILNEWQQGRGLDLPTLVGMALTPPIRKLGVFELDAFFPPKDRTAFAMRLNGLLASPSFGAWMQGASLDIDTMLHTPDGRPRCAIVTTAHLSDDERQFVTTLVLSKLITWMRRQSGTTDLRALLYMDEVAGYLPPTAVPPTKKPIMTLMKQARAFGVGVVLSTQNPVDIDYKALSNAGTWMIGRLQTDRDKMRLLDGMSAASGGVDVGAVGDTISALGKRQFVLKRAGKDQPELFTTRWAMSYLRGPLTRDQIAVLMAGHKATAEVPPAPAVDPVQPAAPAGPTGGGFAPPSGPAAAGPAAPMAAPGAPPTPPTPDGPSASSASAASAASAASTGPRPASPAVDPNATVLAPEVAEGVPVRWIDIAAPWLATAGGDPRGTRRQAVVVARVALRFDDDRAGLVHDEEYEVVVTPLTELLDVSNAIAVDHDDRDLRTDAPPGVTYLLPEAKIRNKTFWTKLQRDLVDHLVRSRSLQLAANPELKLVARPGETDEAFAQRCATAADERADAEIAKLKDTYETRFRRLRDQLQTAENRADVLREEQEGRRNEELISTVGGVLGGIFGGRRRRSVTGSLGQAASRRRRSSAAGARVDAAEDKVQSLSDQLIDLEGDLENEVTAIDVRWSAAAGQISTLSVPLERTDVKVTQLVLGWMPIA